MTSKAIVIGVVAMLALAGGAGIYVLMAHNDNEKGYATTGETVIDAAGREVGVPASLENGIVTIGSNGPLRFLSCFDVHDLVKEVDKGDVTDPKNGRAYSYAYDYTELDYHADNSVDPEMIERIGAKNPSLVVIQLSTWNEYKDLCETLADHFAVVVIPSQSVTEMWTEDYKLAQWMKDMFTILGTILQQEERAEEMISGIEYIISDIRSFVGESNIVTYVAGLTFNGSNSLNTTFPIYLPLMLVDGDNAYAVETDDIRVDLTEETVAKMDFDMIVIDPSSSDKLSDNSSQLVLEYIYGINNDEDPDNDVSLYVTVPIVWDSINYDCVLAAAYHIAHLLYGTLTVDEVIEKTNAVFELFYGENGTNVLTGMEEFFVTKSAKNNTILTMFKDVKVTFDGSKYTIVEA